MGHDRGDRRRARDPALPARPRRLPVHPPLPRPVRHRRVRAERQADGAVSASRPTASPSSGRTGTTSRRSWPRPGCACRPSSRSASGTTCGRPSRSRRTPTSSSGSCPRCRACSSRPASTRRGSSSGRGSGGRPRSGSSPATRRWTSPTSTSRGWAGWATQRRWLHERTVESLGGLYEMHWPGKQPVTARGLRRLPLHHQHQQAGAFLGQAGGWERPLWFEPGVVAPDRPLRLPRPVVVPGRPRGGPGDPRDGRPVRPDDVREVRGRRAGRARRAAAAGHLRPRHRRRAHRLHGPRQRARGHRAGPDDHPARGGPVPRPGPDADPAPDGRAAPQRAAAGRGRHRRDVRLRDAARRRSPVARAAGPADRRGRVERGLAVPAGAADRGRAHPRLGVPRVVHRRAGLGAARADRVRRGSVRAHRRGGRRPRAAPGRLDRLRRRAPGAWLPVVGARHRPARRAVLGRARVHGLAQEGGGLRRARGAGAAARRDRPGAAARLRPDRPRPVARRVDAPRRRARRPRHERRRSPRPSTPSPASPGSTARSTATGASRSPASRSRPGSASTRSTTRKGERLRS